MLTLFIARHGETEWNLEKRMQGWGDSALTLQGQENARQLGIRLKNIEFDAVYSSSSQRALSTAHTICGDRGIPVFKEDKLREMHAGDWGGKDQAFIKENYPEDYFSYWNTPHLYTSATGENFKELQERVLQSLEEIRSRHNEGNVLVVTHSVVIKALTAHFKKNSLENLWLPPFIHDTSLTIVEMDGDNVSIVLEGDTAHVKQLQEKR